MLDDTGPIGYKSATLNRNPNPRSIVMAGESPLNSRSDKLKSAITYVSETMQADPARNRNKVIEDAVVRYDLSPLDCEFFYKHFSEK